MDESNEDFYRKLRDRVLQWAGTEEGKSNKWAEYVLAVPDFFYLLCKLTVDSRVPVMEKAKLGAVIVYFISPIDFLPEMFLGPLGYLDDLALTAYVLNNIISKTSEDIVREHWAGDGDVLLQIKQILKVADDMIGSGLWEKIKKWG